MFNNRINHNGVRAEDILAELRNLVAYQPTTFENGGSHRGEAEISTTADKLLSEVLGSHIRPDDTRALQAALDHVFAFHDVEGHRELHWQQPTYSVQTDLGVELTGQRASFYAYTQTQAEEMRKRIRALRSPISHADEDRMEAVRAGWLVELDDLMSALGRSTPLRPLEIDSAISRLDYYTARAAEAFGVDDQANNENIQSPEDARIVSEFQTTMRYQAGIFDAWRIHRAEDRLSEFIPPPIAINDDIRAVEVPTMLMQLTPLLSALAQNVRQDLSRGLDALAFSDGDQAVTELTYVEGNAEYLISIAELIEWLLRFSRTKAPHLFKAAGRVGLPAVKAEVVLLHDLVATTQDATPPPTFNHPRIEAALGMIRDILRRIVDVMDRVVPDPVGANVNRRNRFRPAGPQLQQQPPAEPAARFRASQERNSLVVQFENRSGDGDSVWDFGDGGFSDETSPWHEYQEPGRYTVTLQYTDPKGDVYIAERRIVVNKAGPEEQQQRE